jgi:acetyl-CoA synthetase
MRGKYFVGRRVEVVMSETVRTIDTLLDERRTFAPSAEFRSRARVTDQSLHEAAAADPDAAVVAKNDAETGQAISAFVTSPSGYDESTELIPELRNHVGKLIGPIARPKWIAFTPDLPKTRSGKIMRRLLRDIAENRQLGDTTTLASATIVADLQRRATEEEAKEQ